MSEKLEFDIWIAVSPDGEYEVGTNDREAKERFEESVQASTIGGRLICITAAIVLPRPVGVFIDVPDEAGTIIEASVEEPTEATS